MVASRVSGSTLPGGGRGEVTGATALSLTYDPATLRSLRADTEDAMAVTASDIRCLIFQRKKRQKGGRTRLQGTHRGPEAGPG